MQVPAYYLTVFVRDQNGKPLAALVDIEGDKKGTDTAGRAVFRVGKGTHEVETDYNGIKKKVLIDVDADASREFIYPLYELTVKVVDEQGRGLVASVAMNDAYQTTDAKGILKFSRVPQDQPKITVNYMGLKKEYTPYLPNENSIRAAFDITPPIVSDLSANYHNGYVRLRAKIVDEGQYASGFSEETPFIVDYNVEGNKRQAEMYPVGNNFYETEMQTLKKSAEIPYKISVSDMDGNRNSLSGMYNLTISTGGGNGGGVIPNAGTEGDLTPIIVVVVVVVVGALIARWYLRRDE